jgi:serine/threonine-protein kinase
VRLEIDEASAPAALEPSIARAPEVFRHLRLAWSIAAVAVVTAASLTAWTFLRGDPAPPAVARLEIVPSAERALWAASPESRSFAISSDGTRLAYVGSATAYGDRQLMVRRLDEIDGSPLPGTAGARGPFFSPDGRWLAFFAGNEIKKILVAGGTPLSVCRIESFRDNQEASGGWISDDTIIFSTDQDENNLLVVPSAGGEAKVLTKTARESQERGFGFPAEIAGTHSLLLTVKLATGPRHIDVLDLDSGVRKTVVADGDIAQYVENGYVVYRSGGTLRAIRFDSDRMEVVGDPAAVIAGGTPASGFSISRAGTLAYVSGLAGVPGQRNGGTRSLVWVDRQGRETPTETPERSYGSFRLSPDGSRAAVDIRDPGGSIWIWDFSRQALSRLTASSDPGTNPVWTPDGLRIAYNTVRANSPWVVTQRADGTGEVEQLTNQPYPAVTKAVTPDGRAVLTAGAAGPGGAGAMGLVPLNQRTDGQVLLEGSGSQNNPDVSPDGRWLAYEADTSGVGEVYVRPFPNVNDGRWQVSTSGGRQPVWSRDGRELFYLDKDGFLTAVAIQPGQAFRASQPKRVLQTRYLAPGASRAYDVSTDGRRFLVMKDTSGESVADKPATIVVVLNWLEELKHLLPTQ